jgi:hypothetical protein
VDRRLAEGLDHEVLGRPVLRAQGDQVVEVAQRHARGVFAAEAQTKADACGRATTIILEQIKRMRDVGPMAEEVRQAVDSYVNGQVFDNESKSQVVRRLVQLRFEGRALDTPQKDMEAYAKLTVADIKAAAQKYLMPDTEYILVNADIAVSPESIREFTESIGREKLKDETITAHGVFAIEKYLLTQRDAFIDMLKEQAAVCRLKAQGGMIEDYFSRNRERNIDRFGGETRPRRDGRSGPHSGGRPGERSDGRPGTRPAISPAWTGRSAVPRSTPERPNSPRRARGDARVSREAPFFPRCWRDATPWPSAARTARPPPPP